MQTFNMARSLILLLLMLVTFFSYSSCFPEEGEAINRKSLNQKMLPKSINHLHQLDSWWYNYAKKESGEEDIVYPRSTNDPNQLNSWWYHYATKKSGADQQAATHNTANDQQVSALFFRMNILKNGTEVVVPVLARTIRKLVSPDLESMLESMELPDVLSILGIAPDSTLARESKNNWENCHSPPMEGEKMVCVSSMERIESFAHSVLEDKKPLKHLASSRTLSSPEHFKIVDVEVVTKKPVVTCHPMVFPYTLYMCHLLPKSDPLKVTLQDAHGELVVVPAMCHMDTSKFDPSHISFKVLHTKPGVGEMCHWFPNSHMLWYTSTEKIDIL